MKRAPFQVLVLPYRRVQNGDIEYAVLKRSDAEYWQFVAGGGEGGESPLEAAKRETSEEAGIPAESNYIPLDSICTVPVVGVTGEFTWGPDIYTIPEHAFGVQYSDGDLKLSREHTEARWVGYAKARTTLKWDSNRNALWELNERLTRQT